ncbi:MAG: ABC-2 type transport system permease protein [Lentisphaeria bacterium]|jgi:ABC-2 type transport system permease protein
MANTHFSIFSLKASWSRTIAVALKELIQMRRDRMTFAMILGVPIMQLLLFGVAINTDPKHLPTAVIGEEQTPVVRTLLSALETSGYYTMTKNLSDVREGENLCAANVRNF